MESAFISENIKRIRSFIGSSQKDVADKAELSVSAYRKIEKGLSQPRVQNLEAIAAALNVSVFELISPVQPLQDVRFRANKSLRSRDQILAQSARRLADYNELEACLGESRPFVLKDLHQSIPSSERSPSVYARKVRLALGLSQEELIRDICGLLDDAGVKILPMDVKTNGFFGLSIGPADGGPAIVVNTWDRISVERWIFTAAHELGHLVMHQSDYGLNDPEEDEVHEREANEFASEFLMPDAVFQREWEEAKGLPLVDRVLKIKRIFKVSYKTVLHRAAPNYQGWAKSIWIQFYHETKKRRGDTKALHEEPEGLSQSAFYGSPAPSSKEPDQLSRSDFQEDRLPYLVRKGVKSGEISLSRGGEILWRSPMEMREYAKSWAG